MGTLLDSYMFMQQLVTKKGLNYKEETGGIRIITTIIPLTDEEKIFVEDYIKVLCPIATVRFE